MKNIFIEENNNRPNYKLFSTIPKEEEKEYIRRYSCINFAILICESFDLKQETFYLAINLFDRFILDKIKRNNFKNINIKLILLTCIFISSKYEEIYPPLIDDFLGLFDSFTKNDILTSENDILKILNFQLHICSPYLFLTKFYSANFSYSNDESFLHSAQFILDLCLISTEFCNHKPSFQAVICLYITKKIFSYNNIYKQKLWTMENEYYTGYSEEEIKNNLKVPIKMIKDFFSGNLFKDFNKTAIFKKYSDCKFSNVVNHLEILFLNYK